MSETRTEKDPLGTLEVPNDAYYGVQTLRAVQNFPISGLKPLPAFVDATVRIKKAAALTHRETGHLEARLEAQSCRLRMGCSPAGTATSLWWMYSKPAQALRTT